MIQLRREMEEAVEREDHRRASEIRDELKRMGRQKREQMSHEKVVTSVNSRLEVGVDAWNWPNLISS